MTDTPSPMKLTPQQFTLLSKGWAPPKLVATKIGVHIATVYRLIKEGELEAQKIGKHQYVKLTSVVTYVGGEEAARLLNLLPEKTSAAQLEGG